jgi:hypothetical protein
MVKTFTSAFDTVEIPLTKEQQEALIQHSNTYWRKYGVRLQQVTHNGVGLDSYVVCYAVWILPECANGPRYEPAWHGKRADIEKVIGRF